ncbi:MAG: hypothetical protein DRJ29_16220 [Bacteroidetes bacterium]|nr:MAG: hypothetical protein DRJ29_16220 [Bacteroidota bacterium]
MQYDLKASCNGVIEIFKKAESRYSGEAEVLQELETVFIIYKNPTADKIFNLNKKRFTNLVNISRDDFSGTKEITWKTVGGRNYDLDQRDCIVLWDDSKFLFFTFNNLENKDYIIFRFEPSEFKLVIDSKISFLFEGGKILNFIITHKPYKQVKKYHETKLQLSVDELESFTASVKFTICLKIGCQTNFISVFLLMLYLFWQKLNYNMKVKPPGSTLLFSMLF